MTTAELLQRLRNRMRDDGGMAMLTEVGNGTGSNHRRWADALAMSLWPSRGLELHGYELKVSRTDWIKERDNPAKAEAVCKYCDRWWVVVGDSDIVKRNELPATWGLIVPNGAALKVAVQAPKLEPVELDRTFVAAIMRRAVEQAADEAALKESYKRGLKEGEKSERDNQSWTSRRNAEEVEKLRKVIADFESASGIKIEHVWRHDAKEIGEAVRMVLAGEHKADLNDLSRIRTAARRILQSMRPLTADLDAHEAKERV